MSDQQLSENSGRRVNADALGGAINDLIERVGGEPTSFDGDLVRQLIQTSLKLIPDGRNTGELKLITSAVKEIRYALRVFGDYTEPHKITIFGSARTPEDHPDYEAAVEFSRLMAEAGWMSITGAGDGIVKAGHVGPGRASSFGVAIRLPFEQSTNEVIAGDAKLVNFKYFFTRKLMFLSQAEAVALFPGGYGTMDEAFETLTLIQTGKSMMIPVVMLEGEGGDYWQRFDRDLVGLLEAKAMINPDDRSSLYRICETPAEAAEHLLRFYRNYHSQRYWRDDLIIRLNQRLRDEDVAALNERFADLVAEGRMTQRGPYAEETDHLDLPRLCFTHTRHDYARVRLLIDAINELDPA